MSAHKEVLVLEGAVSVPYDRQRYARLKEEGLCVRCAKVPHAAGVIHCNTCRARLGKPQGAAGAERRRRAGRRFYKAKKQPDVLPDEFDAFLRGDE